MVGQSGPDIKDVCVGVGKHYCILEFLPKQRKGELRHRRYTLIPKRWFLLIARLIIFNLLSLVSRTGFLIAWKTMPTELLASKAHVKKR